MIKFLSSQKFSKNENVSRIFIENHSFDYNICIFKILPSLAFIYFKEKLKTEERIAHIKFKISLLENENQNNVSMEDWELSQVEEFVQSPDSPEDEKQLNITKKKHLEEILNNEIERLKKINLNYKLEKKDNDLKIKEFTGKAINYKDQIILQHYVSEYYMSVSNKNNKNNTLNKKALLTPYLSKNVLLCFKPRFKYRTLDSFVHYNDDILLCSLKKEFSLKFYQGQMVSINEEKFDFLLRKKLQTNKKEEMQYKCFFTNETPCIWKIIFFSQDRIKNKDIYGGDFIRILHLNNEEYLSADLCYENFESKQEECFVPKKQHQKQKTIDSIWQVNHCDSEIHLSSPFICQNKNNENNLKNSNIILKHFFLQRIIINNNKQCYINRKFNEFKEDQSFCLNSMKSGTEKDDSEKSEKDAVSIEKDIGKATFDIVDLSEKEILKFKFQSILQNVENFADQNGYYLKAEEGYMVVQTKAIDPFWEQNEKKNDKYKKMQDFWNKYQIMVNNNQEVNHIEKKKNFQPSTYQSDIKRYKIQLKENISAEDTFLVEKLTKEELKEIYFLKSFMIYLIKLRSKVNGKEDLKRIDCFKMSQKIRQFSNFLFGIDESVINVNQTLYNQTRVDKRRQSLVREFLIIDILSDILYICHFENDLFQQQNTKKQIVFFEEISKMINETLQFIIEKNPKNVQYCSQWFEMFVKLSIKNSKYGLDLDVELILIQLLKENMFLIKNRISKSSIEKFVQLLIKYRKFQHIKILKNMFECKKRVIYKNQRELTILLLKDEDKRKQFLFKIEKEGENQFRITLPLLGWNKINPNDIISENNIEFDDQNFLFFYESVRLIGKLCQQRNYLCINMLKEQFSFKILIEYINFLDESNFQLKIVFIRLLIYLYIDVYNFSTQQYRCNLRFLKKNAYEDDSKENETNKVQVKKSDQSLLNSNESEMSIMLNSDEMNQNLKQNDQKKNDQSLKKIQKSKDLHEKIKILNKFLESIFKDILSSIQKNELEESFFKYINQSFKLLKIMLKTEIISNKNLKIFYQYLVCVIKEALNKRLMQSNLYTEEQQIQTSSSIISAKIHFCKIIKIIYYKTLKNEISKIYFLNKTNFKKDAIFETLFLKEKEKMNLNFIDKNQLMEIFTDFVIKNESNDFKLTRTGINAIFFLNSKYKFMNNDFNNGVFIKNENELIYNSFENLSVKLEKIAENCQRWLIVDSKNEILELKNHMVDLFGILLRSLKEDKKIWEFSPDLEIDGSDLLQLKKFSNANFILYYINFFFQKEKSETFKFIQNLSISLPILKSFFTILDWSYKFRHFGNLRFKEDTRLMYLLIAILSYDNDQGIDFIVKNYERLLFDLYERQDDFCIVFHNYCRSEKHFIQKIINKSNSLYNFFQIILKRCSEQNNNTLYKSYNFNILSLILSSQKMQNNERVFSNIQLYIFLNLKKYYNLKQLLRDSQQIEEQCKQQTHKLRLHNHEVILLPSDLCLTISILILIKKFALGNNKLTKSVCQSFYSINSIAKIIKSKFVEIFFKVEILEFLNLVYLYPQNTNIFNFKDIINNIWMNLIKLLETNITIINQNEEEQAKKNFNFIEKEEESQIYLMSTSYFNTKFYYREQYVLILLESIKLIILKQQDIKLTEIEKINYIKGLQDYIDIHSQFQKKNVYSKKYHQNMKILRENWSSSESKQERKIEETLITITFKIESNFDDQPDDKTINEIKNIKANIANKMPKQKKISYLKIGKQKQGKTQQKEIQNPLQLLEEKISNENIEIFKFLFNINKNNTVKCQKFLRNLIQFLNKDINEEIKIENPITALSLLRIFIEDVHPKKKGFLDWSEDFFDNQTEEIQNRQNMLIELDIIELIISNVKNYTQDLQIFEETLLLAIGILYGGNKKAQEKFYNHFVNSQENKFLQIIKNKFDLCFEYLKNEFEIFSLTYIQHFLRNEQKDFLKPLKKKVESCEWKKRMKITQMIFRFLQLLCEGHNPNLQHYLREQFQVDDLRRSANINFIEVAAYNFGLIVKYLNPQILRIGEYILDFIIETVQGPCIENQNQLYKSKIVDYINDMFLEFNLPKRMKVQGFFYGINDKELNSFVVKTVKLLNSLVEANNDKNMIEYMTSHIHSQYLINHLTSGFLEFVKEIPQFSKTFKVYEKTKTNETYFDDDEYFKSLIDEDTKVNDFIEDFKNDKEEQKDHFNLQKFLNIFSESKFESKISDLFEIYFLLKFLSEHNEKIKLTLNKLRENEKLSLEFFNKFTGQVEIVYKNKILNFSFIIHPCCFYIEKQQLDTLLRGIKRDTPKDKVKDIISFSKNIYLVMEHRCDLHYKFKKFGINLRFYNLVDSWITLTGVSINLFMIMFFQKRLDFGYGVEDAFFNNRNFIFILLGYLLFVLSLFRLYLWLFIHGSVEIKKFLYTFGKKLKNQIKNFKLKDNMGFAIKQVSEDQKKLTQINPNHFSNTINDVQKLMKIHFNLQGRPHVPVAFIFYIKLIKYFNNKKSLINKISFLSLAVFAIFFDYTFLFSLFLLDIVHHFNILNNLIYAFTRNSTQLFITALLAVLVTYFYSVFAFIYLNPDFFQGDVNGGENVCSNIFHCFLTILSLGPRSTGSIGDIILDITFGNKKHYFIRWIFDFSIWALINLILLNVIFGVIVDTFAELRDLNKAIDDDLENKCLICSLERSLLEKYSFGFKYHVQNEHNINNYLYFIYHLYNKEKTQLTGLESYIYECLSHNKVNWVPILRAKTLDEKKITKQDNNDEKKVDEFLFFSLKLFLNN